MTLEPLLTAPPVVQAHAFGAMAGFALGIVQFLAPKGTLPHKTLGVIWIIIMATVGISSAFIQHPVEPGDPFEIAGPLTIAALLAQRQHLGAGVIAPALEYQAAAAPALLAGVGDEAVVEAERQHGEQPIVGRVAEVARVPHAEGDGAPGPSALTAAASGATAAVRGRPRRGGCRSA